MIARRPALLALALLLLPSAAAAQGPTATPVPAPALQPAPALAAGALLPYLIVILGFALLALALLFYYTYRVQARFYQATEGLGRAGRAVAVTQVEALVRTSGSALEALGEDDEGGGGTLTLAGPGMIPVGEPSEPFRLTAEGTAAPTVVSWEVEPAGAAQVLAAGPAARLVAQVAGPLTLRAHTAAATAEVALTAQAAPDGGAVALPFIGQGFGSIALAIILIAAVLILGLAGILTGEGVATLLGGLLGYLFGAAGRR